MLALFGNRLLLTMFEQIAAEATLSSVASGRKKESCVWEYFRYDTVENKSVRLTKVAGKQYDKLIASSNSTNLTAHLKACHKAEFEEFTEETNYEQEATAGGKCADAKLLVQTSIYYASSLTECKIIVCSS